MKNRMWKKDKDADGRSTAGRLMQLAALGLFCLSLAGTPALAQEGPREFAKRIHDRIAGVPPTDGILNLMEAEVDTGRPGTAMDAAYRAMENPSFYNVTLKNFAAPWTNRDQNVFVPLNDYIATVIGMVRDDKPFNTLLSADIVYVWRRSRTIVLFDWYPSANRCLEPIVALRLRREPTHNKTSQRCSREPHGRYSEMTVKTAFSAFSRFPSWPRSVRYRPSPA